MQIERWRGDTYPDVLTVVTASTQEPANITGCTFNLTVSSVANPVDTRTMIYQVGGSLTDPSNGIVEFPPTVDQANQVGFFYFDVQMVDTYGKVHTLVKGEYIYKQDITK